MDDVGGTRGPAAVHSRGRGDEGASLVEFALLVPILGLFLFGIIEFGYLMSFRGGIAQGAAEGARAAATAPRPVLQSGDPLLLTYPNGLNNGTVLSSALDATNRAVANYNKTCGSGGLTCTFVITDCGSLIDTSALPDCITVSLSYDNTGSNAVMPQIPLLSAAMPSTLNVSSTVQLNNR